MHVIFLILLPLLLISVWVFANYLPNTEQRNSVQRYNRVLAILALLSPVIVIAYFWYLSRHSELTTSWPVLVVFASILLIAIILLLGSALRMMLYDRDDQ